jgi:hypothetical protein
MSAGDAAGVFAYHWDRAASAESMTHPADRLPSFKDQEYLRFCNTILESRAGAGFNAETDTAMMGQCEVAFIFDGGRSVSNKVMMQPWKMGSKGTAAAVGSPEKNANADDDDSNDSKTMSVKHVTLVKDFKSMLANKTVNRSSIAGLQQSVKLLLIHPNSLSLPDIEGLNYDGSNKGNAICGIKVPSDSKDVWQETVASKKLIMGSRGRTAVGGRTANPTKVKREDDSFEPLLYHCWPLRFYQELVHRFLVNCVLDLTPGAGLFGEFCITSSEKIGYVGVAWTATHAQKLEQRLKLHPTGG